MFLINIQVTDNLIGTELNPNPTVCQTVSFNPTTIPSETLNYKWMDNLFLRVIFLKSKAEALTKNTIWAI